MMLGRYPRHRDRSTGRIWGSAWPVVGRRIGGGMAMVVRPLPGARPAAACGAEPPSAPARSSGGFFPLASLLEDRLLVALGVSLTTVALVALVAGLATDVAPSTVTGIGAGTLLTVFGLAALAGVPAEGTSQLSSPRQREG